MQYTNSETAADAVAGAALGGRLPVMSGSCRTMAHYYARLKRLAPPPALPPTAIENNRALVARGAARALFVFSEMLIP